MGQTHFHCFYFGREDKNMCPVRPHTTCAMHRTAEPFGHSGSPLLQAVHTVHKNEAQCTRTRASHSPSRMPLSAGFENTSEVPVLKSSLMEAASTAFLTHPIDTPPSHPLPPHNRTTATLMQEQCRYDSVRTIEGFRNRPRTAYRQRKRYFFPEFIFAGHIFFS